MKAEDQLRRAEAGQAEFAKSGELVIPGYGRLLTLSCGTS